MSLGHYGRLPTIVPSSPLPIASGGAGPTLHCPLHHQPTLQLGPPHQPQQMAHQLDPKEAPPNQSKSHENQNRKFDALLCQKGLVPINKIRTRQKT